MRAALGAVGVLLLTAAVVKAALPRWRWLLVKWRLQRCLVALGLIVLLLAAINEVRTGPP